MNRSERASSDELLALHGLRLLGFAPASRLADRIGLDGDVVDRELAAQVEAGRVVERVGARSGWTLTTEGRRHGQALLAVELDRIGQRSEVTGCYESFLPVNRQLLAVCTRWQVKDLAERVLNDHGDEAYDARVLAELEGIDTRVQPICAELGRCLDRFSGYGPRLAVALERVGNGDHDWFTKPIIESYHTVWFELHEDLLATLGLDRAAESARNGSESTPSEPAGPSPVIG